MAADDLDPGPAPPARQAAAQAAADRRQHCRTRTTWKAAIGFEDDRDLVLASTHDVSVGGASVRAPLDAAPGDLVVLVLSAKERTMPALATVVRAETVADGRRLLHLRFAWLSEASREKLARVTNVSLDDATQP